MKKKYPEKRMIIHFQQPNLPIFFPTKEAKHGKAKYERNRLWILDELKGFLPQLNGKVEIPWFVVNNNHA